MEKIILSNYLGSSIQPNIGKVLTQYQQKYPCSNVLALLYLKMLQEERPKEYEKAKSRLLLAIYDRQRFQQYQISQEHTIDHLIEEQTATAAAAASVTTVPSPSTTAPIEEDVVEKTFEAPTIHLEENQQPVIDSLIAKFSNDPPTIKKTPENHDPLANYSEGSLDEDGELISETLAMIYAEQGYSGKAIKMLKKLSLLYPEKSSIFASQIEKIKIEKNNNQIN